MNERTVFEHLLDLDDADQRADYLDEVGRQDAALRDRVADLLHSHEEAGSFLQGAAVATSATLELPAVIKPGSWIGPYKLRESIGEGGFGIVYVAEQAEPVRRKVAMKIIRPGMATQDVIARFEAERQALAMMDHPNISRVFDGGATDLGQPYFVMELVQGVPITEYCDQHKLPVRDRLALARDVCRAVQHAHQKGIIHRDLKPSNILVAEIDGRAVAKVIDFGVAKAISQKLVDQTIYTQFSQVIGTPLYMSPEQAGVGVVDIDTRSDVYSLGVLLYELLTGQTPFDKETFKEVTFNEMRRMIREDEPPRPSARVSTLGAELISTVAERRSSDQRKFASSLRGELDWIVMRALEKDRARRYQSAGELADDLERYLRDEPIEASPPSPMYRLKKLTYPHKPVLMTAAVVFLALISGTAVAAWQAVRASRAEQAARDRLAEVKRHRNLAEENARETEKQRQAAERAATESQAVSDFLIDDLLGSAKPEETLGRKVTVEEVLENAEAGIDAAFEGQPLVHAAIRHTLGQAQLAIGDYARAQEHLELATKIRTETLGEEHPDTLLSMHSLAIAIRLQGRYTEAEQLCSTVLELRKRVLGEEHLHTLGSMSNLANAIGKQGRHAEAERLHRKVLKAYKRGLGEEHPDTIGNMNNLAIEMYSQDRYAEAEELFRKVLEIRSRVQGEEHPHTLASMNNLASSIGAQGRFTEAEELFRTMLEIEKRVHGEKHPRTLNSMYNLALAIGEQGRYAEAEELHRTVLEIRKRVLGEGHPDTLSCMNELTGLLEEQGKLVEAIVHLEKMVELEPQNSDFRNQLGVAHYRNDNWQSAVTALQKTMQLREGGDSNDWLFLAMAYWQLGQKEKARQWHERAVVSAIRATHLLKWPFPVLIEWFYVLTTTRSPYSASKRGLRYAQRSRQSCPGALAAT